MVCMLWYNIKIMIVFTIKYLIDLLDFMVTMLATIYHTVNSFYYELNRKGHLSLYMVLYFCIVKYNIIIYF